MSLSSCLLYTGQHSIPNIGWSCQKNASNGTSVQIRYLKVKCVIQVMSMLSSGNISLHRLSVHCPRVMAEVFELERDRPEKEKKKVSLVLHSWCFYWWKDAFKTKTLFYSWGSVHLAMWEMMVWFSGVTQKSFELQICVNCNYKPKE